MSYEHSTQMARLSEEMKAFLASDRTVHDRANKAVTEIVATLRDTNNDGNELFDAIVETLARHKIDTLPEKFVFQELLAANADYKHLVHSSQWNRFATGFSKYVDASDYEYSDDSYDGMTTFQGAWGAFRSALLAQWISWTTAAVAEKVFDRNINWTNLWNLYTVVQAPIGIAAAALGATISLTTSAMALRDAIEANDDTAITRAAFGVAVSSYSLFETAKRLLIIAAVNQSATQIADSPFRAADLAAGFAMSGNYEKVASSIGTGAATSLSALGAVSLAANMSITAIVVAFSIKDIVDTWENADSGHAQDVATTVGASVDIAIAVTGLVATIAFISANPVGLAIGSILYGVVIVLQIFNTIWKAGAVDWLSTRVENSILRGDGDDVVKGNTTTKSTTGNDDIKAGGGNDIILALGGDDRIDGGSGDDIISPGANRIIDQTSRYAQQSSVEYIDGGPGNDTLHYNLDPEDRNGINRESMVQYTVNGSRAWKTVGQGDYGLLIDMSEAGADGWIAVAKKGANPNDQTYVVEYFKNIENIFGTDVADWITGDGNNNVLIGYGGPDILKGGDGDDILAGGSGQDRLEGGADEDTIFYSHLSSESWRYKGVAINLETGTTHIWDVHKNETLGLDDTFDSIEHAVGSARSDKLLGSSRANNLFGGDGNDWIEGKGGPDALGGGAHGDRLYGGAGNDIFFAGFNLPKATVNLYWPHNAASSSSSLVRVNSHRPYVGDTIDGGEDSDTLSYEVSDKAKSMRREYDSSKKIDVIKEGDAFSVGWHIDMESGSSHIIFDLNKMILVTKHHPTESGLKWADSVLKSNPLSASGSLIVLNLEQTPLANADGVKLYPAALLTGTWNMDRHFWVQRHPDGFYFADEPVGATEQLGVDRFSNIENVIGSPGSDRIAGDNKDNTLMGKGGNDYILGRGGDDVLNGGPGINLLEGGLGKDTVVYTLDEWSPENSAYLTGMYIDLKEGFSFSLELSTKTGVVTDGVITALHRPQNFVDALPLLAPNWKGKVKTFHFEKGGVFKTYAAGLSAVFEILTPGSKPVSLEGTDYRIDFFDSIEQVVGTKFKDWIKGSDGDDPLLAGAGGDDRIEGRAGSDRLVGGAGDDHLLGGRNNDELIGDAGRDVLDGGPGIDTANYGLETKRTTGVWVDLEGGWQNSQALGAKLPLAEKWSRREDTLISIENVIGTRFSDVVLGSFGKDVDETFFGNDGHDKLLGNGGKDTLVGGSGNDFLEGGSGADRLYDNKLEDQTESRLGDEDRLVGGQGDDTLVSYGGGDILEGGKGSDTFVIGMTGAGRAWIKDFEAGDIIRLIGEINHKNGFGKLTVTQKKGGYVEIRFANASRVLRVETPIAEIRAAIKSAHLTIFLTEGNDSYTSTYEFVAHETIEALGGNDTIRAGKGNDTIKAGPGADVVYGEAGDDLLYGGAGSDELHGGPGFDTVSLTGINGAGSAAAVVDWDRGFVRYENAERDRFTDVEAFVGSSRDEVFLVGSNTISNLIKNGPLVAFPGVDVERAHLLVDGRDGFDWLDFSGASHGAPPSYDQSYIRFDMEAGKGVLQTYKEPVEGKPAEEDVRFVFYALGIEGFVGSPHSDEVLGASRVANAMSMGMGDDLVLLRGGADRVDGEEDVDTVSFALYIHKIKVDLEAGRFEYFDIENRNISGTIHNVENVIASDFADVVRGDSADNVLTGKAGDDSLYGRKGNDMLSGGQGSDRLDGGQHIDTADYSRDQEWRDAGVYVALSAGSGGAASRLQLSPGADPYADAEVVGTVREDELVSIENVVGTRFADRLAGTDGANTLEGRGGNDALEGRGGNDTLSGGQGSDRLDGGQHIDTADYSRDQKWRTAGVLVNLLHGRAFREALPSQGFASIQSLLALDFVGLLGTLEENFVHEDTLVSIENAVGTRFADRLAGTDGANTLKGREGNDGLYGRKGNDTLSGGRGRDILARIDHQSLCMGMGSMVYERVIRHLHIQEFPSPWLHSVHHSN